MKTQPAPPCVPLVSRSLFHFPKLQHSTTTITLVLVECSGNCRSSSSSFNQDPIVVAILSKPANRRMDRSKSSRGPGTSEDRFWMAQKYWEKKGSQCCRTIRTRGKYLEYLLLDLKDITHGFDFTTQEINWDCSIPLRIWIGGYLRIYHIGLIKKTCFRLR